MFFRNKFRTHLYHCHNSAWRVLGSLKAFSIPSYFELLLSIFWFGGEESLLLFFFWFLVKIPDFGLLPMAGCFSLSIHMSHPTQNVLYSSPWLYLDGDIYVSLFICLNIFFWMLSSKFCSYWVIIFEACIKTNPISVLTIEQFILLETTSDDMCLRRPR